MFCWFDCRYDMFDQWQLYINARKLLHLTFEINLKLVTVTICAIVVVYFMLTGFTFFANERWDEAGQQVIVPLMTWSLVAFPLTEFLSPKNVSGSSRRTGNNQMVSHLAHCRVTSRADTSLVYHWLNHTWTKLLGGWCWNKACHFLQGGEYADIDGYCNCEPVVLETWGSSVSQLSISNMISMYNINGTFYIFYYGSHCNFSC